MATFHFRCPTTKENVEASWPADDLTEHGDTYLPVQCTACRQVHYVSPITGEVLGGEQVDDDFP